jgi:adenosylhomocysteine nucleosidase
MSVPISAARPASQGTLLCISGLAAEARIARRAGFGVVVGAANRPRTAALAAAAAAEADCLVSFGIAGSLSTALRPGDLILSAEVVSEHGCWRGNDPWRCRLAELAVAIGAVAAPMFGSGEILAAPADKARAHAQYGALAVDLESDIVARAAVAAGIPFAVLRAIADPVDRALPQAAQFPLRPDGRPDLARIVGALLHRPRETAGLAGLARETRRALAALARAAPALDRLAPPMACRPATA